jgi:hypothetical protein
MSACPWCGSDKAPLPTIDHLDEAEFVYVKPSKCAAQRNPCMCPDCHGVGGREDFMGWVSE